MTIAATNQRFRVATENLTEISLDLIGKNFEELDPCTSESELDSKIFIDVEKKTFYFLDDECLEQSNGIIADKFNLTAEPVDFEEIQKWN
jgi:hypothetical protein